MGALKLKEDADHVHTVGTARSREPPLCPTLAPTAGIATLDATSGGAPSGPFTSADKAPIGAGSGGL